MPRRPTWFCAGACCRCVHRPGGSPKGNSSFTAARCVVKTPNAVFGIANNTSRAVLEGQCAATIRSATRVPHVEILPAHSTQHRRSHVRRLARARAALPAVGRAAAHLDTQVLTAGGKTFVDYAGQRPSVDSTTGEIVPVELVVAVLGASTLPTRRPRSRNAVSISSRATREPSSTWRRLRGDRAGSTAHRRGRSVPL